MTLTGLLAGLPAQAGTTTRQLSPENPQGTKSGACTRTPDLQDPDLPHCFAAKDLGRGWKVRPFVKISAGATVTLADVSGPGIINHMWIATDAAVYRAVVLRCYWDDEEHPSIEVPLGDFFAMGHDAERHPVDSLPVIVAPKGGMNCYWQMPFRRRARITLQNDGAKDIGVVAYKILYKQCEVPAEWSYFHAQWRRSVTTRTNPEHVILDGVRGEGIYVGTYLAWSALSRGWWGEGEVKFFLDGDGEFPTLSDTGTEDYFGGAWCFYQNPDREQTYSTAFLGMPLARVDDVAGPRLFSLYRWHLYDAIGFAQDLKVTVQALGWFPDGTYEPLTDDIASVAYWYQRHPHAPYPTLPSLRERWGR